MHHAVEQSCQELLRSGLATETSLRGCTETDVLALETATKLTVPRVYRDFLLTMGMGAGDFLLGSDFLVSELQDINEAARELIEDSPQTTLPANAFVFVMHQGYQFLYFLADEGDDPPVYRFLEGEGPTRVADAFSSWLSRSVADEVRLARST